MKVIRLKSCQTCPYRSNSGGFGMTKYIPTCSKKQNKRLPFQKEQKGDHVVAKPIFIIPEWCPLEDEK